MAEGRTGEGGGEMGSGGSGGSLRMEKLRQRNGTWGESGGAGGSLRLGKIRHRYVSREGRGGV